MLSKLKSIPTLLLSLKFIRFSYNHASEIHPEDSMVSIFPGGPLYYPRPGQIDPVYEPSKLLLIQRVKPLRGTLKTEKSVLEKFGLGCREKSGKKVVVKNIPSINSELWKVKHLIKVIPITFPNGEPENDDDLWSTLLKENGEFIKLLKITSKEAQLLLGPPEKEDSKMDARTISKYAKKEWYY